MAASKNLLLQFPSVQAVITTDRILLTQLLQNLVGNSLKYTARGTVSISLHTDADALALDVEDSGVGIPEDKLDRIFDEYCRWIPKGTQRSGVGLGLAIVREVSRLLGYSVAVSRHGQWNTGARAHTAAAAELRRRRARQHRSPRRTARCHAAASYFSRTTIRCGPRRNYSWASGAETRSAGTVAEAETLLADLQPDDLFISDYHLGDKLTGFDVLQSLRARHNRDLSRHPLERRSAIHDAHREERSATLPLSKQTRGHECTTCRDRGIDRLTGGPLAVDPTPAACAVDAPPMPGRRARHSSTALQALRVMR